MTQPGGQRKGATRGLYRSRICAALTVLPGALAATSAWAQGCAMCRSSIAAQNDSVVASINAGILILLVPPLAIMSTILYFAFRARD